MCAIPPPQAVGTSVVVGVSANPNLMLYSTRSKDHLLVF